MGLFFNAVQTGWQRATRCTDCNLCATFLVCVLFQAVVMIPTELKYVSFQNNSW